MSTAAPSPQLLKLSSGESAILHGPLLPNLGHKRKYYIFLFESQMSSVGNVDAGVQKKMVCSGRGLH